jgi:hypothetical protein
MAAPMLDGHIRQIRNIQVCRLDLEPLLPQAEQKLPSTTINAFGACLQYFLDSTSEAHGSDLIILSSWLGPLATGKIRDGGNEGSFNEHVMAAVSHFILLLSNKLGSIFISVRTEQRRISFSATAGQFHFVPARKTRTGFLDV